MKTDLIQSIADPCVLVSSEWVVLDANVAFKEWMQVDIVGREFKYLTEKFSKWRALENLTEALSKGESVNFEVNDSSHIELNVIRLSLKRSIVRFKRHRIEPILTKRSSYKSLIAKSPIATAIYRPNGSPKYFNEAYGKIWGAPSEMGRALVKGTTYNIFEDEQLDDIGLTPFVQKGFSGETVDIPPVRYNPGKTKSLAHLGIDQERYLKGHIYPVKDNTGAIQEVAFVISDITFQMQAEEILTENHLKFQLLTMGLPGVIYEYDFEGDTSFTFLSQGSIEMFGYTPEEIINDQFLITSMIHKDDLEEFTRSSLEAAQKREKWEWQGRFIVNGEVKWIEGKSDTRGANPNTRYGMLLDVTERVLTEKRSKHNELLFGQLFENSPLGLVLLDEEHHVIQINQGFKDIFGYDHEELVGKILNNVLVPEDESQAALDINLLTARGEVGKLESWRLHKDGTRIPVIIYGVPVTMENETIGIYGIYVDITERTRIENELKVRNDELDNFVYKVSHDLRAPLSSVLGLVNLARLEDSAKSLRQYVGMIENRIQLLDAFINDVLSHSKNLKLQVEISNIDLRNVVNKCFSDLSYLTNADSIKVSIDITGTQFFSDPWRVNEIFRNLISNAIKYVDIEKPESFVDISINVDETNALVVVKDNGIGISQKTLPKIFDMFYRATESSEGSGIGLYIVKNAVDKLKGSIKIESKEHIGTEFKISLPNHTKN
ncbi:MAG: PAS domain-containing sensor histidine kinase [Bacteroidota bacterium]